jgi:hypothetical protein
MQQQMKWYRRRPFYSMLGVALVALAIPVSYAVAGGGGSVVSPVEKHNEDCGDSEGKKVIGTDTFKRSGDTLYVTHKLSGADPGRHYYLYLYDAGTVGCDYIGYLGNFKVDGNGSGSKSGSRDVSGTTGKFVVCDWNNDTSTYDCGLTVQLGPDES